MSNLNTYIQLARSVFQKKQELYGPSWLWLRPHALLDHIFIKALRIRTISSKGSQQIKNESEQDDWLAIINYSIMMLIRLNHDNNKLQNPTHILQAWEKSITDITQLQKKKTHDYGDAWKQMHYSSFIDIVLTRVERMRSILGNNAVSWEDLSPDQKKLLADQLKDIVNYSLFALHFLDKARTR